MTNPVVLTVVIEEQTVLVTAEQNPSIDITTVSEPFTVVTVPGQTGARGAPGNNSQVIGEIPYGATDGVNCAFATAHVFVQGSTALYRNGLREALGTDYFENGADSILLSEAPLPDDDIRLDYVVGA